MNIELSNRKIDENEVHIKETPFEEIMNESCKVLEA